jgi:ComF family protein
MGGLNLLISGIAERMADGFMGLVADIKEFLFPRTCPGCGSGLKEGEHAVCLSCLLEMPMTGFHAYPQNNPLFLRLAGRVQLEGASALYFFEKKGRLKRVVSDLKYRKNPQIGYELGKLAAECMGRNEWVNAWEAVIPVPLHKRRVAHRGYNQSERFAAGLAEVLGIPLYSDRLVRLQHTSTQTQKGKNERWDNVEHAFILKGVLPSHVLLVDDIVTTGATTEACIRTLQSHGPQKVSLMALAIAR